MKKVLLTVVLFACFGLAASAKSEPCPKPGRAISSCHGFSGCVTYHPPLTGFLEIDFRGPQSPTDEQMARVQSVLDDLLCD
jgi:hypothetical protein